MRVGIVMSNVEGIAGLDRLAASGAAGEAGHDEGTRFQARTLVTRASVRAVLDALALLRGHRKSSALICLDLAADAVGSPEQSLRKQYHFWPSDDGVDAWDVDRLVELSRDLPVEQVPLTSIWELDTAYWSQPLTVRDVADHARLVQAVDLSYPIILGEDGRVMDGVHRDSAGAIRRTPDDFTPSGSMCIRSRITATATGTRFPIQIPLTIERRAESVRYLRGRAPSRRGGSECRR